MQAKLLLQCQAADSEVNMRLKLAIGISILTILVGMGLSAVWFYWSIVDYTALNASWTRLMTLSHTPGISTQHLMVVIADQDAHRLNMVAEIAGMMIGALIAAVGGLGLIVCITRREHMSSYG